MENRIYTLNDIKYGYVIDKVDQDFATYLRERYIQVYDKDLNFLGYEIK